MGALPLWGALASAHVFSLPLNKEKRFPLGRLNLGVQPSEPMIKTLKLNLASLTLFSLISVLLIGCQTSDKPIPCDEPPLAITAAQTNGMLRLQWRLQSQENVYGFQAYQSEKKEGPWLLANEEIIPGHDTTSIPQTYHYYITGLEVGKKYFFYIDEVTYSGQTNKISPIGSSTAKPRDYYLEKGYEDVP